MNKFICNQFTCHHTKFLTRDSSSSNSKAKFQSGNYAFDHGSGSVQDTPDRAGLVNPGMFFVGAPDL
jgi:hypothetical protein